tara:strand:+ start:6481 stop:7302 length:822 start_codon:yes stop_codon:yes gene_type:complete
MATKENILKELSKPLTINQIEFRIQSISVNGWATILAYKDARVDMNRLDEVCGINWQRDHKEIKGVVYGGIGIRVEANEDGSGEPYWVWRWDAGTESNTEKQKGEASDSYKRAGFNFGIGRELYDYPRIFLQLKGIKDVSEEKYAEFKAKTSQGGKEIGTSHWGLDLKKWIWDIEFDNNNQVKRFTGKDQHGVLRYDSNKEFNSLPKGNAPKPKVEVKNEVKSNINTLPKITKELFTQAKTYKTKAEIENLFTKYSMDDKVKIALQNIADTLK